MNWPKPNRTLLILMLPLAACLGLRAPGLWRAPIFNDEAIYSLWVAQMLGHPSLESALLPWHDDKMGPLPWSVAVLDAAAWPGKWGPLLLWRYMSLACGLFSTGLIMLLAWRMADGPDPRRRRLAAFAAGLGWAVWPLAVMHERMALFDGPLATAWLVAMLAVQTLPRRGSTRRAAAAGLACALPLAIKTSGLPALAIGGAVCVYLWVRERIGARQLAAFCAAAAAVALPLLALSASFGTFATIQHRYLQSGGGHLGADFPVLLGQLARLLWFSIFCPALALMAIGALTKRSGQSGPDASRLWLAAWSLLPIGLMLLVGKNGTVYTRYYLPFLAPAWVAFGLGAAWLLGRLPGPAAIGLMLLACVGPTWQSLTWIKTPDRALLADQDHHQYVSGWPSGRQVETLRAALEPLYARGRVDFITFNSYANPAAALQYIERNRPDRLRIVEVKTTAEAARLLAEPSPGATRLLFEIAGRDPFDAAQLPHGAATLWSFHSGAPWPHDQKVWWIPPAGARAK